MAIMGWFNSSAVSPVDRSAQLKCDVFPYMASALWAALGINLVATPYGSGSRTDLRFAAAMEAATARRSVSAGRVRSIGHSPKLRLAFTRRQHRFFTQQVGRQEKNRRPGTSAAGCDKSRIDIIVDTIRRHDAANPLGAGREQREDGRVPGTRCDRIAGRSTSCTSATIGTLALKRLGERRHPAELPPDHSVPQRRESGRRRARNRQPSRRPCSPADRPTGGCRWLRRPESRPRAGSGRK